MTLSPGNQHQPESASKSKLVRWIFLAVGLVFTGMGVSFLYTSYSFRQTALTTTAEVLSVERIKTRKRDNDGNWKTTISYKPTLRYEDQFGARHVGAPNLRSSSYNFPVGSEVEVSFNPDDPSDMRVNDFMSTWGFGAIFTLFGVIFVAIGWFVTRGRKLKHKPKAASVNRMR
jgi:hypothetical protein